MALRMGTTQGRLVLLVTVLGSGIAMLDATVVNVALARIGEDLDAGFSQLQWTVNGYTLTLAALILLGGSLGDRFGRRRVFLVGTVWFAVASLLCGIAPSIEALIAARALQGIGGALLTPGSLAIISAVFVGTDRAAAIGAWSGLSGLATAAGPLLGGWLVGLDWRLIFLINIPVAVVVVVVASRYVPESRDEHASTRLDLAGTLLAAGGLGLLTYGLIAAGDQGWTWFIVTTLAAGVFALAGFVAVERSSRHPLVPLSLFADRQFSGTNLVTFLVYAALAAQVILLVLQLQVVAGYSALLAGTAMLPTTVIMLVFSSGAGRLGERIGPRIPMTAGPLIAAAAQPLLLRIGPDTSYWLDVLPGVLVFSVGLTLTVAPLTSTALSSAPTRFAGIASGVNNAVARAAGLLAVAVVPVAAGISGGDYQDPIAFDHGFRIALWICAGLLAGGGLLALALIRKPG